MYVNTYLIENMIANAISSANNENVYPVLDIPLTNGM